LIFWAVVLMGLVTLGLLLTGDLLAWDQNSITSSQVRVNFLSLLPGIGGELRKLAAGGPGFGHLTLTRFLALHVGLLTGSLLALLVLHGVLRHRADYAEADSADRFVGVDGAKESSPYWPQQAMHNAIACLLVMTAIFVLALVWGVELGSPGDPQRSYAAARPEWAFLGLYQFSNLFPGHLKILPIFVIPGLLLVTVLAMPWIARIKGGHAFNLCLTGVLLVGTVMLSLMAVRKDKKDESYRAAMAEEHKWADRVVELADLAQGIPPGGAMALLRNDPKTQGPVLFKTHCAGCHDCVDTEGKGIKADEVSAPNLFAYAGRDWVAGWLDPKAIAGPHYLGNTKFKRGEMTGFIREMFEDVDDQELAELRQDFRKVAAALSAEAGLKSQQELDTNNAAVIEEGKALLVDDFGCVDCHKFHQKGSLGGAPDLTGYGSRQWTMAIISNPARKQFYGRSDDRMPAYAEFPADAAKNVLSSRDIGLLTDWLRGQWQEIGMRDEGRGAILLK
jgi:ubiquinol-cytochrome c reductase cytochrome b subunit